MKSVALVPFCPLPADTGGKVEMLKHLDALRELGRCTIVSAATKPVGTGWTPATREALTTRGFEVVLREEQVGRSPAMWAGIAYAAFFKGLRLEKAFGHSNPYHRNAFPPAWWEARTRDADLAVIHYSYWAHLPCACPKVVVLMDLWSDFMWEGPQREMAELKTADRVVVISKDEQATLCRAGIRDPLWSPPAVASCAAPDNERVGLVGSGSLSNREGLEWLAGGMTVGMPGIHVYGALGEFVRTPGFLVEGRYEDALQPYRDCGVILMTTAQGMGVQIKAIEALAAGRAIVARPGAMRGLPPGEGAWVEAATPQMMLEEMRRLVHDASARQALAARARGYYQNHLDRTKVLDQLKAAYMAAADHRD